MASKPGTSAVVESSHDVYRRICHEERQLLRIEASFADPPVTHWGFVIYRTAYGQDTDSLFQRLMTTIEADAAEMLGMAGRLDLADKLRWEVIDDQERFDSVATEVVREDFIQWTLQRGVPPRELRPGQQPVYHPDGRPVHWVEYGAARFHYCVVVDQRSLESVRRPGSTNGHRGPVVAIVSKDWLPLWHPEVLRGSTYQDLTGGLPPIEGNPDEDVGFFYCAALALVDSYNVLCDLNTWGRPGLPCRPPEIYDWHRDKDKWRGDKLEGHDKRLLTSSLWSES